MADVSYSVNVDFKQSGTIDAGLGISNATSKLSSLDGAFSKVSSAAGSFNSVLDSIASSVTNLAMSAAKGVGTVLAGGFGMAVREAFKFNEEVENSQTGIATMANAAEGLNGFLDPKEAFGNQYRLAGDMIKQMRKDAQMLPGSFSDLQRIMTDISGPAENIGIGQSGVEKLSADAMSAAAAMNLPFKQVGMQIGEMLSGSARVTNRTFRGLNTGYAAKDFNKLSDKDRFHVTQAALAKMQGGRDSAQQNWSTISSNFVDNLKIGVGLVGGPLMSRVKDVMKAFNDGDKGGISSIGERVGSGLVKAFDYGMSAFGRFLPMAETFAMSMYHGFQRVFTQLSPLFEMVGAQLSAFFNNPLAFQKIEHLVGQFLALRAGTGVLESGAGMGGGLMKMASGAGMGAAELGPAAIAIGAAVGLAAIAVAGFTSALTDGESKVHEAAVNTAKGGTAAAARLGRELGDNGSMFKDASELFGVGVARVGEYIVGTAADWAHSLNALGDASMDLANFWRNLVGAKSAGPRVDPALVGIANDAYNESLENRAGLLDLTSRRFMDAHEMPEREAKKPPVHNTTIHRVEIKVNSNQDPSRIAKMTKDVLLDLSRHPQVSRGGPQQFSKQ